MDGPDGACRESEGLRSPGEEAGEYNAIGSTSETLRTPVPDASIGKSMAVNEDANVVDRTTFLPNLNHSVSDVSSGSSRVPASPTLHTSNVHYHYTRSDDDEDSFSIHPGPRSPIAIFISPGPTPKPMGRSPSNISRVRSTPGHQPSGTAPWKRNDDCSGSGGANSSDYDASNSSDSSISQEDESRSWQAEATVNRPPTLPNDTLARAASSGSNAKKNSLPIALNPVNAASASAQKDGNEEQAQGRKESTTKKKLMPPKDFVIPRRGFRDVVRKVFTDLGHTDFSIQGGALDLLQEVVESVILPELFDDLRFVALHAKRVTVMPSDAKLRRELIEGRAAFKASQNKEDTR